MPKIAPDEWSFYFPDDGETKDHAIPIIGRIFDADHAAREACSYDYSSRHGQERSGESFKIIVISPEGLEHSFNGWHHPTIEHRVAPAKATAGSQSGGDIAAAL